MKESPITPYHRANGATISNEEGWRMPGIYTDILREHRAAKAACGIFDISHLGKWWVQGPGAQDWLEYMLSNKVADCAPGHGRRTLLLNEEGGIIDRLTLFCEKEESYFLLGSAALAQEDYTWLAAHLPDAAPRLQDATERLSGMALYGPESYDVLLRVLPQLHTPHDMSIQHVNHHGESLILTACGLEGDEGFELFCPAIRGIHWFETFIRAGATPCGLATRECLRLERNKISAGRDMNSKTTPHLAGLEHLCHPNKTFVGAAAAQRKAAHPPHKKIVPIECTVLSPAPRHGYSVQNLQGRSIGSITSGCISPESGLGIAFAYINSTHSAPGTPLLINMQGTLVPARVSHRRIS